MGDAGRGDQQIGRRVDTAIVILHHRLIEALDGFAGTQNRFAERMVFPEIRRKNLVYQIIRAVGVHLDFFENDALFLLDIFLAKRGFSTRSLKTSSATGKCSSSTFVLKQTISFAVKASRFPPIESTERAISSADRLAVPLKSMCSMKCEMPFCSAVSRREPLETHTPTDTDRTCGMVSVMTLIPFGRVVVRISRSIPKLAGCGLDCIWMDDNLVNLFIYTIFGPPGSRRPGMLD